MIEAVIDKHIFEALRHRLAARVAAGLITREKQALWLESLADVEKRLIEEREGRAGAE